MRRAALRMFLLAARQRAKRLGPREAQGRPIGQPVMMTLSILIRALLDRARRGAAWEFSSKQRPRMD